MTTTEEPDAPSTFTTVSESTTSITISWTAPAEDGGEAITDYEIDWNQGSVTNSWTPIASTTSGSTSYTKNGLTVPQETYKFRVRAKNLVGLSEDSAEYSVTTTSVPSAPSAFNTDAQNTSSITISWTEPSDGGQTITNY